MMSWLARQDGYDPNAFDVPLDQGTNVGWANRMGEILTTRPQYDETVQYKTASPLVNITEGDIGRATEAAMGVSGGGLSVKGYHGSPVTNLTKILAEPPTRQFDNATSQFGAFLAPSSQGAERYAGKTGRIYSAEIPAVKPYEMPWNEFNYFQSPEKNIKGERHGGEFWGPRAEELRTEALALKQKLQAAGHDSILVRRPDGTLIEIASFGDVPLPPGIRAYHSSPHDFDKFDLAKIGTGEGAQVYGHGLYFAESPAVSGQGGQYWQQFLPRMSADEQQAARRLAAENFDRKAAIETTQQILDRAKYPERFADQQRMLELLKGDKPVGPRTYEVNINADPAHMLDWDKPLRADAPKKVQDAFNQIANSRSDIKDKFYEAFSRNDPGSIYYSILGDTARTGDLARNQIAATNTLREAGIPGIKYLDQGSRGPAQTIELLKKNLEKPGWLPETRASLQSQLDELLKKPPPSSNYVIFDPNIIDITKKYAVPGAIGAGGMGALAAQNQYEEVY